MEYEVNGLPMHVLLVHATVIVIPVAALCTILSLVWPTARRRLGIVTPLVALAALVLVPITQRAGEWLLERIDETRLVQEHQELGGMMLPWVLAVFIAALGQWLWFRYGTTAAAGIRSKLGKVGTRILAALAVLVVAGVCVGATVMIVQVGESGARSVWQGSYNEG